MAIPWTVLAFSAGARAQSCDPAAASVISVQGDVQVSGHDRAHWRDVQLNQVLCAGQQVRLMAKSRAVVKLPNETLIHLDEGSVFTLRAIEPDKPAWLDLLRGALHIISRVPRALNIRTPFVTAGIEGTEFALRVQKEEAALWVYEGRVRFSNRLGHLLIASGEAAAAAPGRAPERRIVIKPRRAVEWALYYPPLLDTRPERYPEALRAALTAYRQNDFPAAFAALDGVPEGARDARYHTLRAGILLSVGRVLEAEGDLTSAQRRDPKNGTAYALRSVIAVVRNKTEEALKLAAEAVRLAPGSATPYVARSYAEQSAFEIEKAHESLEKAAELAPEDALVWARLAEIELSLGDLDAALESARKAEQRDPGLSRTQTVLGFAYLTRIEVDKAKSAFERAIQGDPADPLPRLGLGLAKIREGDVDEGTKEIETAASLDPNNSLVRSYLGKAYYEQKRGGLASTEFEQAKLLDPKDPTPWFYSAIHKQTTNRPVEALHDLQKAINLNDNRAVYRSRLLLDEDLAARGAALGRIYRELGFEQSALTEGWKSLSQDPTDFSAHRLLADTYSALPRHEIARVSELLQSQLLQSTNITPVQPQLAESDLFLLGGLGPAEPSLNEFNSLFLRNRLSLLGSGLVGSHETYGDEVVQSGIWNNLSYSLGQFHYESDGFRPNNDLHTNIYTAFTQYALNPHANVQIELRHNEIAAGDLREFSNPDFLFESLRQTFDGDSARFGLRLSLDPGSDLLGSFTYSNDNRDIDNPSFTPIADTFSKLSPEILALLPRGLNNIEQTTNKVDNKTFELQYIRRSNWINTVIGVGYTRQERTKATLTGGNLTSPLSPNLQQELEGVGLPPESATLLIGLVNGLQTSDLDRENSEESHLNGYFYSTIKPLDNLNLSIGTGVDSLHRNSDQSDRLDVTSVYVSPKIGAIWEPFRSTRIRAAWFRTVKRPFPSGQTIEPTQVAGFNQLFDDGEGTRFQRYGVGVDQKLPWNLLSGFEFTWRDLKIPRFFTSSGGSLQETKRIVQEETAYRAYLHWIPTRQTTLSAEYFYEQFDREFEADLPTGRFLTFDVGTPLDMKLHRVPLSLNYYHPNGFFAGVTATYVVQDVTLRGETKRGDQVLADVASASDRFWQTDLSIGYRLPKRYGILRFGVLNLFAEDIRFQEANVDVIGDIEDEPLQALFAPEQVLFGQLTLAF